jgi:hypothetical protein
MATERVVSHYNRVKTEDRACLKQTTINNVLQISLNGKGTVLFDPREAVAEFLKRKSRRNSQPDTELFKDREYMRKFYRESMFVNYFCLVTLVVACVAGPQFYGGPDLQRAGFWRAWGAKSCPLQIRPPIKLRACHAGYFSGECQSGTRVEQSGTGTLSTLHFIYNHFSIFCIFSEINCIC